MSVDATTEKGPMRSVRSGRMVRPIHFRGHDMDASSVLTVDPVTTHSTGSMECMWEYGFTVRFTGNSVTILCPKPSQYGYGGGPSREQYKAAADKMRADFLRLLWPNSDYPAEPRILKRAGD